MNAFSAVVFWKLVRAIALGYVGAWFFPSVVAEAINASFAFLVIAIADWAMRRYGRLPQAATRAMIRAVEYVALVAYFGKGWVEPHTSVSIFLQIDGGLNVSLVCIGLAIGVVAGRAESRLGAAVGNALVWSFTGWLICGPEVYAAFDGVEAGGRATGLLAIGVLFAGLAVVSAWLVSKTNGRVVSRAAALLAAAAAAVALVLPGPGASGNGQSVVLVVIDTLRADALDRRTVHGDFLMPRLRELAARGVRFDNAVAPSPWTLPSTVTILSGLNPFRHEVGRVSGFGALPLRGKEQAAFLGPYLRDAGYQVAGFVNNPYLRRYYGLGTGYLRFRRYHGNARDGRAIAASWIVRHRSRPFFALVHFMDPHWPYQAPAGYGEPRNQCTQCDDLAALQYTATSDDVRTEVRRRYDAETAFVDAEIGRLYDELVDHDATDDVWLVIVADHGEEFWEHLHFLHGHSLYDDVLRVPFIVVPPTNVDSATRGRRVEYQVRLEDVIPTVFDVLALDPPADIELDGMTLGPELSGLSVTKRPARPLVAGFLQQGDPGAFAVRVSQQKLISSAASDHLELYDLRTDPREVRNLALEDDAAVRALSEVPSALGLRLLPRESPASPVPKRIGADLRSELRALGYVD